MFKYKCTTGQYIQGNYNVQLTAPLKYRRYGQAGILITPDGTKILYSYITPVLALTGGGCLHVRGTYSPTTRRHISAFLKEHAPAVDYSVIKEIAGTGATYNINTGEVKQRSEHALYFIEQYYKKHAAIITRR